jgi:hypothetical protein
VQQRWATLHVAQEGYFGRVTVTLPVFLLGEGDCDLASVFPRVHVLDGIGHLLQALKLCGVDERRYLAFAHVLHKTQDISAPSAVLLQEGGREGGREGGGQEGGQEGRRAGGQEGGQEEGREGRRKGGREGGQEEGREGGREGGSERASQRGREGGKDVGTCRRSFMCGRHSCAKWLRKKPATNSQKFSALLLLLYKVTIQRTFEDGICRAWMQIWPTI